MPLRTGTTTWRTSGLARMHLIGGGVIAGRGARGATSKEHLEGGVENWAVVVVFHQGGRQGRAERLTIDEVNHGRGTSRVDVLRHGDGQPGGAQLANEVTQDFVHDERRPKSSFCAVSMSLWYLSKMCSVAAASSSPMSD